MIFFVTQKEPLKFDVNLCGAPEEIAHLVDNIKKVLIFLFIFIYYVSNNYRCIILGG